MSYIINSLVDIADPVYSFFVIPFRVLLGLWRQKAEASVVTYFVNYIFVICTLPEQSLYSRSPY